ncbi:MAG TPA: hydrogenase maturation protease [Chthoniobacterales bacterium]|jgi:hydrogenase maturation protease|nr:hydrogenase maturation protease [Chthoniobacterales bacterium]
MSRPSKILVAGTGNIFLGDDAFGSEVARRLMSERLPPEVRVIDFGIRTYDLAYAILDGYDVTILIDITAQGQAPGTVYLIEPDLNQLDQFDTNLADAHSMNPVRVLQMLRRFGSSPGKLYLIGCEPAILEVEDGEIGMSETVEKSVPRAIEWIKTLIDDLLKESPKKKEVETI